MEFKKITHCDKQILDKYILPWKTENSDYNFTALYLWGKHGKIQYAEQDGVLYCYYNLPNYPQFFLPPFPADLNADYSIAVNTAVSEMQKMGFSPCFHLVSEPFFELLKNALKNPKIERTPENDDYVYLASDLIELKGKKLHSKRNHINTFLNDNKNWEYVNIDETSLGECMSLYEEWSENKKEPTLDYYDERLTVELAIKHMHELKLVGGGIRINGVLKAFSIGEHTLDNMITVHIEKADASINGLFSLINQQFIQHESKGTEFVNREEDMGLEGLRKAKQSYHPCRMIEKYIFTLPD